MKIKIAIQKSGRMHDDSIRILKECGLEVDKSKDQLKAAVNGFPAELLFLRNSDIPKYLEDGVADLAVIGENTLAEKEVDVAIVEKLGFSKCRLSIAIPKDQTYNSINDLEGKKIATSYPKSLKNYLSNNGVKADIHMISGSVEIAPNIGLASAICDLVSTGSTLFKNGLEEKEIILKSEAVIAANKKALSEKKDLIDQLSFRLRSVLKAINYRYILMNVPNDKIQTISSILPVLKSPTVLPLLEEGWSSIHSVIGKEDFWDVINELKANGAEGILICPVEKMVV